MIATLQEIPLPFKEALAYHESFLRLGYAPDEIFLVVIYQQLFVELRADNRTFRAIVGSTPSRSREEVARLWAQSVQVWNSLSAEERDRSWRDSYVAQNSVGFLTALVGKGFVRHMDTQNG